MPESDFVYCLFPNFFPRAYPPRPQNFTPFRADRLSSPPPGRTFTVILCVRSSQRLPRRPRLFFPENQSFPFLFSCPLRCNLLPKRGISTETFLPLLCTPRWCSRPAQLHSPQSGAPFWRHSLPLFLHRLIALTNALPGLPSI